MAYGAFNDWTDSGPVKKTSEAEELFLKDLYTYMKKRDSPIERIPNLGFKQSKDIARLITLANSPAEEMPQPSRFHVLFYRNVPNKRDENVSEVLFCL